MHLNSSKVYNPFGMLPGPPPGNSEKVQVHRCISRSSRYLPMSRVFNNRLRRIHSYEPNQNPGGKLSKADLLSSSAENSLVI